MPSELKLPPERRYLVVTDVLAPEWVAETRVKAIPARAASLPSLSTAEYRHRMNEFLAIPQEELGLPLLVLGPDADIPVGRVFTFVFSCGDPEINCESLLILKHIVTWDVVADHVWYGHHALCFFECPLGPPALLTSIPRTRNGAELREGDSLGLCNQSDWPVIRNELIVRAANSPQPQSGSPPGGAGAGKNIE